MGDSYREELKKHRSGSPRSGGDTSAADARSKAIKRESSRKTLRARAKEAAVQGRLLDA